MSLKWRLTHAAARAGMACGLVRTLGIRLAKRLADDASRAGNELPKKGSFTVLALSPARFRGDLEMLTGSGEVTVVRMPEVWQARMLRLFHSEKVWGETLHNPSESQRRRQLIHREFLRQFLGGFLPVLKVDAVIGADVRYAEDIDIGVVSRKLGIPYLVFHRENLLAAEEIYQTVRDRMKKLGGFLGTHLVVHNNTCRQMFLDAGFVDPRNVSVLGAMRMDAYLRRLVSVASNTTSLKSNSICIFPFIYDREWFDYPESVFSGAHQAFAMFAQRHPDVEVIVKPKLEDAKKTPVLEWIRTAVCQTGISLEELPNFSIRPELDAQDLIENCRVVAGMDSTVVLEAAIAGRPVIVPYFDELRRPPFESRVKFHRHMELFDTPENVEEMLAILEARYVDPGIPPDVIEARKAVFEEYVSPLNGRVTQEYVKLLKTVADDAVSDNGSNKPSLH